MNRCFYIAKAIFLGLLTAQILSTIQVYLSNADLFRKLTSIRDAGYLAIPNPQIIDSLQEFGPAFFGGLFFTLTAGAGLCVLSFAAAWVWDRILCRKKFLLIIFVLLWMLSLVGVNRRGFSPMVSSYFLVIPAVVFIGTLRWMPGEDKQRVWMHRMVHFLCITLLALLWASQMGSHMFLNIRDNLLLSNPVGRKINDFYYKYTLYPAEVFKSLDQKALKTCSIESMKQEPTVLALEKELLNYDYLNVRGHERVDLEILQEGNILFFKNEGRTILRVALKNFFSGPGRVLKEFSFKSDKYGFFRQFTFLSLLVGFPLTLYVIVHALFCIALRFFADLRHSSVMASILCFLLGIALLIPLHLGGEKEIDVKELAEASESERWQERVAALKIIEQERVEVGELKAYQTMLASPHVPERYWLVKALGVSRQPGTYRDLLAFLDDSCPNVVSMAFYALGQRGDKRAIKEIIKKIEVSDDWYNQWYGYKALRNLGWKQTKSQTRL
jgi:hypothetical protein